MNNSGRRLVYDGPKKKATQQLKQIIQLKEINQRKKN